LVIESKDIDFSDGVFNGYNAGINPTDLDTSMIRLDLLENINQPIPMKSHGNRLIQIYYYNYKYFSLTKKLLYKNVGQYKITQTNENVKTAQVENCNTSRSKPCYRLCFVVQ